MDIQYILTGRRTAALPDRSQPMPRDVRIDDQDYAVIRVFDVDVSAGKGIVVNTEAVEDQIAFPVDWLTRHSLSADLAGIVRVSGDSMAPTVPDRAHVLVDFSGRADFSVPGIYIVRYDGEIVLKRLQTGITDDERWAALVSDNPAYPPVFVKDRDAVDFQPIARVRAVLHTL